MPNGGPTKTYLAFDFGAESGRAVLAQLHAGTSRTEEVHRLYLLARESEWVFKDQNLPGAIVLTGSAKAVVPKNESEAYDTSKAALNHLIRELAIRLGPHVRVNGIAPATVVAGSTMFPRDRVIQSLQKYGIEFSETESTENLRAKLAEFYARCTLTKQQILPQHRANAIVWLASDQSAKTTGHVIPVDGGLSEAFLR